MYTLGDVPRKGATLFPDKVAMVFEGTRITYREVDDRINRFANALMALGCKKGDRLAILSENTCKYMEVYLAAAKAGMSGGPVVDRDGRLVGVLVRASDPLDGSQYVRAVRLTHIVSELEAAFRALPADVQQAMAGYLERRG